MWDLEKQKPLTQVKWGIRTARTWWQQDGVRHFNFTTMAGISPMLPPPMELFALFYIFWILLGLGFFWRIIYMSLSSYVRLVF